MRILNQLRQLHPGQVVILGFVLMAAAAGLQSVRSNVAARTEEADSWLIIGRRALLSVDDSLQVLAADTTTLRALGSYASISENRRRIGLPPITYSRFLEFQRQSDSLTQTHLRSRGTNLQSYIDSLQAVSAVARKDKSLRLVSLDLVIAALVLTLLSLLWIWLGGRERNRLERVP